MTPKSAQRTIEERIAEVAQVQEGMVSHAQLLALGLTREGIKGRARRGLVHRRHRGVYAVGHPRRSVESDRWAAVLALGDGAVLSHRTAADVWGIRPSNTRIVDVTVPTRNGRKARRGIRLHWGPLASNEVSRKNGLPVTTVPRTFLDLAAVLTPRALERATDEAQGSGLFNREAVEAVLEAHPNSPGRAKLAAVLATHRPGSTATRSPPEELFLALCREHGLPQPEVNVPIEPYVADFLWPDQHLIVETDARGTHGTAKAFEHDRARDAYLAVKGYRVVRYTDRRLKREPGRVMAEVRALLALG